MSWGTDFRTDIFISKQVFGSKGDIEMKLEELDKTINGIEAQIKMYASSTPKDIIPDDWKEEPVNWLDIRLNELFENYQEALDERYKIYLYRDYVNENNIDLTKNNNTEDLPF
jgi:hypothetical protein